MNSCAAKTNKRALCAGDDDNDATRNFFDALNEKRRNDDAHIKDMFDRHNANKPVHTCQMLKEAGCEPVRFVRRSFYWEETWWGTVRQEEFVHDWMLTSTKLEIEAIRRERTKSGYCE